MFHDVNTRPEAFCPQTCLSSLLLQGIKEGHFLFCFHESCFSCHLSRPKCWKETDWKVSDYCIIVSHLPETFTSVHCHLPNYQIHWFPTPCPCFFIALDLFFKVFILLTSLMLEFSSYLVLIWFSIFLPNSVSSSFRGCKHQGASILLKIIYIVCNKCFFYYFQVHPLSLCFHCVLVHTQMRNMHTYTMYICE